MAQFIIHGGEKLKGEIAVSGAKNAVLKILPAAILCKEPVLVQNVPNIEDVNRMIELMQNLGASIETDAIISDRTLCIDTRRMRTSAVPDAIAKRLRSSIMLVGPLLARFGTATFPHPGGCVIGQRPIDLFLDGFRALGATVEEHARQQYPEYRIDGRRMRGADYTFKSVSVTGTECLMMTATLLKGKTILRNAAMEPEIPALAEFLNGCGARIRGAGTHTIEIQGVTRLRGGTCTVIPDRIDAGSFAILAAATKSALTIKNVIPEHIATVLETLRSMGVSIDTRAHSVSIRSPVTLAAHGIKTHEYPGFPTDLQAPFAVLATQARGMTLIHETIYEGRLFYIESLNRMGAKVIMCDPHRILVHGPTPLHGREMESPDLRAGLAFVIAALAARGTSVIDDIYSIDRGYEHIEERLRNLGADIQRIE